MSTTDFEEVSHQSHGSESSSFDCSSAFREWKFDEWRWHAILTGRFQAGYLDKNQKYIEDASALVSKETLDWISIMSYEMGHHYRHWTGIHAPLHIGSKTPWDQKWSIARSVAYWHKAKIPLDKIQIGLPAYGKIFQTTLQGEAKAQLRPNPEFGGSLLYQPQEYPRVQMEVPDIWNPEDPWGTGSKLIWELDFCNTFRNQEHVKIHGVSFFANRKRPRYGLTGINALSLLVYCSLPNSSPMEFSMPKARQYQVKA